MSHTNVWERSEMKNIFRMKRQFVGFVSGLIFFVSFSIKRKSDPNGAFNLFVYQFCYDHNPFIVRTEWITSHQGDITTTSFLIGHILSSDLFRMYDKKIDNFIFE